ncbi:hypothetical protein Bca4012_000848 [Brassica carinata]
MAWASVRWASRSRKVSLDSLTLPNVTTRTTKRGNFGTQQQMRETFLDQLYRKNLPESATWTTSKRQRRLSSLILSMDPYSEGADFVRGYPFSFRSGVLCAASGAGLNFL